MYEKSRAKKSRTKKREQFIKIRQKWVSFCNLNSISKSNIFIIPDNHLI